MTFLKLLILTWLLAGCVNVAFPDNKDNDIYIELETPQKTVVVGQPVNVSVTLFSQDPNIAFARLTENPTLDHGDFNYIRKIQSAQRGSRVKIGNKTWYKFPIETFVFSVGEKGKYSFRLPGYEVGVNKRVIVRDPFWGNVQSTETERHTLDCVDFKFKVTDLPEAGKGESFSGAVGDFEVKTLMPRGDILVGEEAMAYVTVSGPGLIPESAMPEYRSAFSNGLTLKSVSEDRSEKFIDGRVVSVLTLELTFIPVNRDGSEIGSIFFSFYNPESGKFKTVKSEPVAVKPKSSTVRREHMDI